MDKFTFRKVNWWFMKIRILDRTNLSPKSFNFWNHKTISNWNRISRQPNELKLHFTVESTTTNSKLITESYPKYDVTDNIFNYLIFYFTTWKKVFFKQNDSFLCQIKKIVVFDIWWDTYSTRDFLSQTAVFNLPVVDLSFPLTIGLKPRTHI